MNKFMKQVSGIAVAVSLGLVPLAVTTSASAASIKYVANCKSNNASITSAKVYFDKGANEVTSIRLYGKNLTCSYIEDQYGDLASTPYLSKTTNTNRYDINLSKGSSSYLLMKPGRYTSLGVNDVTKSGKLAVTYRSYHNSTPGKKVALSEIKTTKYKTATIEATVVKY